MSEPTIQEIQSRQGTRLSETAPWDSYDHELTGRKVSPELAAQIAEYAQKRYQDAPVSSQAQEVLAENRELNQNIAKEYQWVTPEEYANQEERVGRVMHSSELITLLRKAGLVCFYQEHPLPDRAKLLVSIRGAKLELGCWVQLGHMPELSMFNFDQYGAPLAEKRRGWRTVLLQLILKGAITEEKANEIFGKPKITQAYARYNGILQGWRQRDKGWDE
jgi:hypothetical protein